MVSLLHHIEQILNSLPKGRTERPANVNFQIMQVLMQALGNPHLSIKNSIHIAGTNGKGSTAAFLTKFLESQGYSVNMYTSPHLVTVTERIYIKGEYISSQKVLSWLNQLMEVHAEIPFNYFHALTAIAFQAYRESPADFTIVETGLGGRYDATNVIQTPLATVFTPISFDHVAFLGATLSEIAAEKAAIAKPGVPILSAFQSHEALSVLSQKAQEMGSEFVREGKDWSYTQKDSEFIFKSKDFEINFPLLSLKGGHQLQNASLAISTLLYLKLISTMSAFKSSISQVKWPGRLMNVSYKGATILFDGAHNISAAHAIARYLEDSLQGEKISLIFSMTQKDYVLPFLEILKPYIDSLFCPFLLLPFVERSIIETTCFNLKISYKGFDSLEACLQAVTDLATAKIMVTGSLYLVGEVLRLIESEEN